MLVENARDGREADWGRIWEWKVLKAFREGMAMGLASFGSYA